MGIYCLYTYNAYFYFNSNKRSQILAYHPNIYWKRYEDQF